MSDGSLFLDGQAATVAVADRRFAELAEASGEVWYYREAGQSEPSEEAREEARDVMKKVMASVAKHRLPVSLSTKPDFSDVLDVEKGVAVPRR